ncbi:UDP-glycosyltransferase 88F3-like [Curcuma longa]|uniref:UDP-glycosyltransferase 88F3-like n=1 Tax=Curcuma longa TaxID=136217 RepID=UPI003D9ED404
MATTENGEKEMVVLYPSPGMGHLVSMVELGRLFLQRGLAVTIVTVDPPYNTGSTAAFIARASAANPGIAFHRLPPVDLPPNPSSHHPEALAFDLLRRSNSNLLAFLRSLSPAPRALVLDMFCLFALDVAVPLHIPCFLFFISGAAVLNVFLHFPSLDVACAPSSFRNLAGTPLSIPGVPPLPADHMCLPLLDRDDDAYRGFVYLANRAPEVKGIFVNSFRELEPRALEAVAAGLCLTDGRSTPPVYPIGPLITERKTDGGGECLAWLDALPNASVVFLCFGSIGQFEEEQLREIATGLDRSGHRFLWVVRSPPSHDPSKRFEAPPEPDLDALLPEGFLERTRARGLVVKAWAPQSEVLRHAAVGGFVTHCGWNSILEAVVAGVPMLGWPLYAEQRMNKVFLVEEMQVAAAVEGYEGLVPAEEIETKVRWLMESEGGRRLRERAADIKEMAAAAVGEGGSSQAALGELVAQLKGGKDNGEGVGNTES